MIVPYRSCSGAREPPVAGVLLSGTKRAAFSSGDGAPEGDIGLPSMLGAVAAGLVLHAESAAKLAPSESIFRRLGVFFFMGSGYHKPGV